MTYAANFSEAPARKTEKSRPIKAAPRSSQTQDEDLDRLQRLAASGRRGVDLSKLSREEIRAHLFGD